MDRLQRPPRRTEARPGTLSTFPRNTCVILRRSPRISVLRLRPNRQPAHPKSRKYNSRHAECALAEQFKTIEPKILYFGTPVALITSLNEDGFTNLAPISSFWALGWTMMLGQDRGEPGASPGVCRQHPSSGVLAKRRKTGAAHRQASGSGDQTQPVSFREGQVPRLRLYRTAERTCPACAGRRVPFPT